VLPPASLSELVAPHPLCANDRETNHRVKFRLRG
jgi:hypothetical protein